jgi:hypothetical protein
MIVIGYVPIGVVLLADRVSTLVVVTGLIEKTEVTPTG